MEKLLRLAFGIILSCLLAGPAMAGGDGAGAVTPPAAQVEPPPEGAISESGVSQIQIDIMNKREQARQRKEEMLKVRTQTIKAEEEEAKKLAK